MRIVADLQVQVGSLALHGYAQQIINVHGRVHRLAREIDPIMMPPE
jgi:hypothetical protein